MKYFIYNLAVYVPNTKDKKMEVQGTQFKTEKKLTQEDINEFAKIKKGNVLVTYVGVLKETNNPIEFQSDFYSEKEIEKLKARFNNGKEKDTSNKVQ